MVNGYVNAEPGYPQTAAVMNPSQELIIDVYGTDRSHARTAIGVRHRPIQPAGRYLGRNRDLPRPNPEAL